MPTITAQELKSKLSQNEDVLLVDVRSAEEHAGENIGGINVPLSHIEAGEFSHIPKDKDVVLYCRSGARSGLAQTMLIQKGYGNISNLAGGMLGFGK